MATALKPDERTFTRKALIVTGLVLLVLFLGRIAPVLMLAFAGAVLATAIRAASDPLGRWLRLPDLAAVSLVSILALALLIGGGYLFGQRLAEEAAALWVAIEEAWGRFREFVGKIPVGENAVSNLESGADPERDDADTGADPAAGPAPRAARDRRHGCRQGDGGRGALTGSRVQQRERRMDTRPVGRTACTQARTS